MRKRRGFSLSITISQAANRCWANLRTPLLVIGGFGNRYRYSKHCKSISSFHEFYLLFRDLRPTRSGSPRFRVPIRRVGGNGFITWSLHEWNTFMELLPIVSGTWSRCILIRSKAKHRGFRWSWAYKKLHDRATWKYKLNGVHTRSSSMGLLIILSTGSMLCYSIFICLTYISYKDWSWA